MNKSHRIWLAITLLALVFTAFSTHYLTVQGFDDSDATVASDNGKKPLYWVAPMDPKYRRNEPGKSPMGMDLIPVYQQPDAAEAGPGTVLISPAVENNLGVRTAEVQLRRMHTDITSVAYVQYDQDKLVHIHPRVEGWIEKLYVKAAGDPVVQGHALYSLYSPQLVNAQEELVLALNRSNPRLVQAAEDRLKALQIDATVISRLKRGRKVQQTLTFYAPQSGVVDKLNIREGFFVQPGTTLMSVGNLSDVWVEAEFFERQTAGIKANLPATVTLDYFPGKQWQGQVDYVYPVLDPETRTLRARVRLDNADGLLKPNMFARVTIHTDSADEVLVIPREAVIRTGQQDRVVLVLGEGRFKSIAVSIGRIDDQDAEVTEGLKQGERLVTSAQFLLDSESSKSSDFKRMDAVEQDLSKSTAPTSMPKMDPSDGVHDSMDHESMDHSAHQSQPAK
jgi:Cu(I)/Ag(I) efflux system membrane fusion protein